MSNIGKRATAIHPHCRRIKNIVRHQISPLKACAEKQIASVPKQKSSKKCQKAKINRKPFDSRPNRTIVTKYLCQIANWQKQFREDKFFRYRVISRRYLRKLSLQQNPKTNENERRKISWSDENQILVFDCQKNPATIKLEPTFKEAPRVHFS